jgi:hypothetical protein
VAFPGSFTPNGGTLAFAQFEGGGFQIMTVAIDQNGGLKAGAPQPYLAPRLAGLNPVFSPNGRWLAYQSPESGVDEVYVRPFPSPPDGSGLVKISNGGGASPNWSRAADELLYLSGTQLMAVPYTVNGNVFTADAARPWGTVKSVGSAFDLAPEGKRALVVVPTASAGREHTVVFLQNFFDELRRRVPLPR